jgi:hypothetical protein
MDRLLICAKAAADEVRSYIKKNSKKRQKSTVNAVEIESLNIKLPQDLNQANIHFLYACR